MTLRELELRATGGRTHSAPKLAELDPEFAALTEALFGRTQAPRHLSPVRHAAVALALDALVTQLDHARLEVRVRTARHVLSEPQVLTILQLVSVAGLHSMSTGAPALAEEVVNRFGRPEATDDQQRIREEFETAGPRPRPMDAMYASILERDPAYFAAFRSWLDHPWQSGTLDHGTLHLVCIALDIACTHLYESGFRRHAREAFDLGVGPDEIFEVIEIASVEGLRTIFVGTSLLSADQG